MYGYSDVLHFLPLVKQLSQVKNKSYEKISNCTLEIKQTLESHVGRQKQSDKKFSGQEDKNDLIDHLLRLQKENKTLHSRDPR